MKAAEFRKGIYETLMCMGFSRQGQLVCVSGDGATVLLGVGKGFSNQWFINVGFCLVRLGIYLPNQIERAHMYFRLERLFPQHRESIIAAGELNDIGQPKAYQDFIGLLTNEIVEDLRCLGTEQGIINAYRIGRLREGLITASAKEILIDLSMRTPVSCPC